MNFLTKIGLTFAVVILILSFGNTQALEVTGVVVDTTGSPIEGVIARIIETGTTDTTDTEGQFTIPAPTDSVTLTFKKDGYVSTTRIVPVSEEFPLLSILTVMLVLETTPVAIDSGGGTIDMGDGIKLVIPEGALDSLTEISLTPLRADQVPEASNFNFIRVKGFDLEPHGLSFNVPVEIQFPVDYLLDVEMFDLPDDSVFVVGQFNWDSLSYTEGVATVVIDTNSFIASFEVDHFSDVIMYDDFGFGDYWAHWVVISCALRTFTDYCTDVNCEQTEIKAPDVTIVESFALATTQGSSAEVGVEGGLDFEGLGSLKADLGVKVEKSVTQSSQTSIGVTFFGAQYQPPQEGTVCTRLWYKQKTYTFYEKSVFGDPYVIFEFVIRWDFSSQNIANLLPTFVELSSFNVTSNGHNLYIEWTTATEIDNAGFNIHRGLSKDSPNAQLNPELIPAQGDELQGASYSFTDYDVTSGVTYYYWLEDVDLRGNSTMHGPVSATPTSVEEREEAPIPTVVSLAQNYPNPFNATTEIKYGLPMESYVNLTIYNLAGQKMATLVDGKQNAGYKTARWDASSFSSGIYFYRLQAGDFVQTRKMVLIR